MIRFLLLLNILIFSCPTFGQQQEENQLLFSESLALHLPKYEKKVKKAYYYKQYDKANRLFDSLVNHQLNGSYMDNFKFYKLNSKPISLHNFKKPIYLITYASWCVATEGEIPAINQLANKYQDKIDFVVLFWDNQRTAKEVAKSYNKNITVVYVDELKNNDSFVVSKLKHSLGLPTTFLIDADKKILDIKRGIQHAYGKSYEKSFDMNYNLIYDGIANHLLDKKDFDTNPEPVALN